jgi:preprotein translocase subunit SecD
MKKRGFYYKFSFILFLTVFSALFVFGEFLKIGPSFFRKPFSFGLDLKGGSRIIYEPDLTRIPPSERMGAIEGARDVIERRIETKENIFGTASEVQVTVVKSGEKYRIVVELPGIEDVKKAIEKIGETPLLEFKEENPDYWSHLESSSTSTELEAATTTNELLNLEPWKYTGIDGSKLKTAGISFDQTTGAPQVFLEFNEEGTKLFEEVTKRNVGKPLAIFLDGKSIIDTNGDGVIDENDLYAPVVKEPITTGHAVISGKMTIDEAKILAQRLKNGALPVALGEPVYQKTIGPTLGIVSLKGSLKALVFGFLLILLFMVFYYRLPGIIAGFVLIIYLLIVATLIKAIPVTLTLAGVGGMILSLATAVDGNILIFERLKEELREEKPFSLAIEEAFSRTWSAIRDANITNLIVAFLMYFMGTSFIKAFALTLALGVFVSIFSSMFITRVFLEMFENTRFEKIKILWRR